MICLGSGISSVYLPKHELEEPRTINCKLCGHPDYSHSRLDDGACLICIIKAADDGD